MTTRSRILRVALAGVAAALLSAPGALAQRPDPPPRPTPTDAQAGAPPSSARPPFPNRANEVLPSWLRVRGEFRERFEGSDGAGFVPGRRDAYWLSRVRFNASVTPARMLSFQAQAQDARVARKSVGPAGAPFRAPLDLRMAFADVGSATSPVALRIGRQELAYGEQRLVGHVSWLNAARTFDAARLTFRHQAFHVDAFAASVVRILDGEFDKSGNGNRFAGAYVAIPRLLPRGANGTDGPTPGSPPHAGAQGAFAKADAGYYLETLEPYVFFRRDTNLRAESGTVDDLAQSTVGVRAAGRLPGRLDYGVEVAAQRGSLGPDEVSAWAGHWQLRGSLPGPGAVRLTAEYNYASGDEDPVDGVRGTFDQLYPTPHDKYGLADQIGWKNIHHSRAGFEFTPLGGLPIAANYHSWWIAEPRDALYAAGGAVLARAAGGALDRHVGHELDVQVSRALTPQIQVAAGYAYIFTGAFLEQATPGASYSHPYVMATYVFLAER